MSSYQSNGGRDPYVVALEGRVAEVERRQTDDGAKLLAAVRDLNEVMLRATKGFGDAHADLMAKVVGLHTKVNKLLAKRKRRRRRGA